MIILLQILQLSQILSIIQISKTFFCLNSFGLTFKLNALMFSLFELDMLQQTKMH